MVYLKGGHYLQPTCVVLPWRNLKDSRELLTGLLEYGDSHFRSHKFVILCYSNMLLEWQNAQ